MRTMRLRPTGTLSGWAAALGAAMTVTALLAVTAVASRSPLSSEGQAVAPVGGGRSQINAPPWALVLVAGGAGLALLGVIALIRWELPRRHPRDEPPPRRVFAFPLAARIMALLIPLLLGAVLVVAAIEGSRARTPLRPPSGKLLPRTGKAPKPRQPSSYNPPTWILPAVVGVVLGGGGAVLLVVALRRRVGEPVELRPVFGVEAALGEAVEESLEGLRSEPDPRRAVIAAYRRMEATLARAGLPRRAWEAPREYAGRVENHLELSAGPLETLTALFERARFGVGRVDESLRERAIQALVELRDELLQVGGGVAT